MDYLESLLAARSQFSFDEQIRYLGWALLLMWMLSITYMTREFWFPAAFGEKTSYEVQRQASLSRKYSTADRRLSFMKLKDVITQLSDRDLRLLADESRRKCQLYLMKQNRRTSKKDYDARWPLYGQPSVMWPMLMDPWHGESVITCHKLRLSVE